MCVCAIIYKFKQVLSVSYKRVYPWIWVLLVEIMFDHGVSCCQTGWQPGWWSVHGAMVLKCVERESALAQVTLTVSGRNLVTPEWPFSSSLQAFKLWQRGKNNFIISLVDILLFSNFIVCSISFKVQFFSIWSMKPPGCVEIGVPKRS